jgi:hypothetical protein
MGAQAYGRAMERAGAEIDGVTLALTLLDGTAIEGEDDVGTSVAGPGETPEPAPAASANDAGEPPGVPDATDAAEPAALSAAADEPDAPAAT